MTLGELHRLFEIMTFDIQLAASIPLDAQGVPFLEKYAGGTFLEYLTNSMFVSAVVVAVILFLARQACRRMELVPTGSQNVFEAFVEVLYDLFEGIVGRKMIVKAFGLLATIFLYILIANWFALVPGVGSIGWGTPVGPLNVPEIDVPLLRPATADMNTTLALALIFMGFWLYWTFAEVGVGGFIKHTFGVKGGITGLMLIPLALIFAFVGVIEVISMAFRPVSLSLRLFGNVFAGENLLVTMIGLGKTLGFPDIIAYISSVIVPVPFYFLELMIGLLQALVFTLLCAVYLQLSTAHEEEHH